MPNTNHLPNHNPRHFTADAPQTTCNKSKPTVFRVTNNLNIGGVQRRLRTLLPLLTKDFNVHVIVYKERGVLADELEAAGVKIHFVPMHGKWDPVGIWKMSRLMKKYKADIVHGHSLGGNIAGILAGALAGVPVRIGQIHSFGNHWYASSKWGKKKQIFQEALVQKLFSQQMLCVSRQCQKLFTHETGLPAGFATVLHNGITLVDTSQINTTAFDVRQKYNIDPDELLIGFVGRLEPRKGLDYLANTAHKLAKLGESSQNQEHKKYTFMIVGSGSKKIEEKLAADFAELAEAKNIRFIQVGEQEKVYPFYLAFDLLFMPSEPLSEGFSGVTLEAAALGRPILSRKAEPVEELKEYYPRIHIMDDADDPKEAIEKTLALPPADLEAFKNAFSLESMAERTTLLYKKLLKEKT